MVNHLYVHLVFLLDNIGKRRKKIPRFSEWPAGKSEGGTLAVSGGAGLGVVTISETPQEKT